ncbi:unnamed protein product [Adineta steineri]|uniref:NHL repeat containing protein n=1 Tax=Adineta steineri TaxID=433720 RepID=A0A818X141_9BILA|nr:unnamed protein product [Adineta steineri]
MELIPILGTPNEPITKTNDNHLESFSLIWLTNNENVDIQKELRNIINHIEIFDNVEQCKTYIETTSENDRLVLVTNGEFGQQIIPFIHQLRQISSIYINSEDQQWTNDTPKLKGIHAKMDELVSQIRKDHKNPRKIEEPVWVNMFTTISGAEKSTTGINGQFAFSQLLLDCLLRLKSNENDRNELISYCEKEYEGNENELNHLHEFEGSYSSDHVLWWYTRPSFFYKTLNAALRKQNIHMIYLYRSFIIDIQNQLENHQCQSATRVYRSQLISIDELNYLKNSVGQYVSVNSFLSTSIQKEVAIFYLGDTNHRWIDLEKVLFEIDADPKVVTTKPFAHISQFSNFTEELEVLFMLGSIFRLISIIRDDENQIWIIQMCLCGDDEHNLKQILMEMKNEIANGETNLCILGKVVRRMGHLDLAKKYYYRCLDELSQNDPLLLTVYKDLAKIASHEKDYEEHLRLRHILAKIKEEIQLNGNEIQTNEIDKLTDNETIQKRKSKNYLRCNWHLKLLICSFILILVIGIGIFTFKYMTTKNLPTSSEKPTLSFNQPKLCPTADWNPYGSTFANQTTIGNYPRALFIDINNTVYAVNTQKQQILMWINNSINPDEIISGKFFDAVSIFVTNNGDIYYDNGERNGRVDKWTLSTNTSVDIMNIDSPCYGLFVDINDTLYCSMYDSHKVIKIWFNGSEMILTTAAGTGTQGSAANELWSPWGIFVDPRFNLYVADCVNNRIQLFQYGELNGATIVGEESSGNIISLDCPSGIVLDADEYLFIIDQGNHRIIRSGSNGIRCIIGCDGKGSQSHQLFVPTSLSFDIYRNIFITDSFNRRIQKFDLLLNSCDTTSTVQSIYSSILTEQHSIYFRIDCDLTNYYYEAIQMNVSESRYYSLNINSSIDIYAYIYTDHFYPSGPFMNLITKNVDSFDKIQFEFRAFLRSTTANILVVTKSSPNVTGAFSVIVSGVNHVTFERLNISSVAQSNYSSALTENHPMYSQNGCDLSTYYEAIQVNVNESGYYTFASNSSIDISGIMYKDDFNPVNGLQNLILRDTSSIVQSMYSSVLATNNQIYNRDSVKKTYYYYYYEAIQINVATDGFYMITSNSNIDTYGYIYNNSFNPFNPSVNLISEDDDGCSFRRFRLEVNLLVNVAYILVVTTSDADVTGAFSIIVSGLTNSSIKRVIPLPRAPAIDIHPNATWQQNGLTVAGGNGYGNETDQLANPLGLYVDDDETIYVTDGDNSRVVAWKSDAKNGRVVAGGNERGNRSHQLSLASDVIVDKENDSLIICDSSNNRIVQWPRRNGKNGVTIISNIDCMGLTIDEGRSLYLVDVKKHEVRKYRREESEGTVVAGGNGKGNRLDQLNHPSYVFVDQNHSVYVSDTKNHRVMKWEEGAKQGIVVAGGQGQGNNLTQLSEPQGIVVDQLGTIYVTDYYNSRIMRWKKESTQGSVIVGGSDPKERSYQLYCFVGLSFDRRGNLYAADSCNHQVQKFDIEETKN